MNLFKLLCQYHEPYHIRHGWGLSPIRNNRELKALIYFCKQELQQEYMKFNLAKQDVLSETIRLYELEDRHLYQYITNHTDWYWS